MKSVIVVCGFPRCGSSLTMQMLRAGGVPCVGQAPSFEDLRTARPLDPSWVATLSGQAVKVLDPQRNTIPRGADVVAIWIDRDPVQQARSQAKFMRLLQGVSVNPSHQQRIAESLIADRPLALASLSTWRRLTLSFEGILEHPAGTALAISEFLDGGLNEEAMASVVRARESVCAPGLDMEMALIREAGAA